MSSCVFARERRGPRLVDFVHHAEGAAGHVLEADEVEHGGDGALAAGLAVRGELAEVLPVAEADHDAGLVLAEVAVFGLVEVDGADGADDAERVGELVGDRGDDGAELREPHVAAGLDARVHLCAEGG